MASESGWNMPKGDLMKGKRGVVMGVANQNSIAWGIASQLAAQGRDAEAEALYARGLADFPHDARLANSAGNFHFKAGRLDRALKGLS